MRSITTLLILSSASVFGAAVLGTQNTTISTRHDGGFGATCSGFALSGDSSSNYILRASCPNNDGTVIFSSLYLNGCVANDNGVLACQKNGGYGSTCETLGFEFFGSTDVQLHANCKNSHGGISNDLLDLNKCIGNHNGQIDCIVRLRFIFAGNGR
ncbi:Cyanovirin-N [Mycena rosella]|uniref:Cyanovirin-N n=1 Tax=Mycena rosella TaxID=1033263 RepID=A0AAD7GHW3_MYCRO|nr:Cyanovirin-N [Mycena rosella]